MQKMRVLTWYFGIVLAALIGILLATGIRSGLLFQFDPDEFAHAQVAYLILHGLVPYREFFMTYTPVFHIFISPVFMLFGFSMGGMYAARWFMTILFLLRVTLTAWIAMRVFGKRIAVIFLLLFLADPFTVYSAMQIRPDNFMMLLFTGGLALFLSGAFFWSGLLLAVSGVVLLKIAPAIFVIWVAVLFQKRGVGLFLLGFLIPLVLFFSYTLATGNTNEMLRQVVTDPYAINRSVAFPLPITHFYSVKSGLFDLYGSAWNRLPYIAWLLLLLAAFGLFLVRPVSAASRRILTGILIVQGISLVLVHSVFVQYFLPITWLVDLFAAALIARGTRRMIPLAVIILLLLVFSFDSANANISRSHTVSNDLTRWLTRIWNRVPVNAASYPNIPFRPLAYPLPFGYYFHDLPLPIIRRLPPLTATLEKNKPAYILQTYEWNALPQDFFIYVDDRYHKIDTDVFVRNN